MAHHWNVLMRRVPLILALACSCLAQAYVQSTCFAGTSGALAGVGSGHTLIAWSVVALDYSSPTLSVSDSLNGSYTVPSGGTINSGGVVGVVGYIQSSASGSDTITVSYSGTASLDTCVYEASGLSTFDATALASTYTASPTVSAPSITATATDFVISSGIGPGGGFSSATVGSPYTDRQQAADYVLADRGTASAGTVAGAVWTPAFFGYSVGEMTLGFKTGSAPATPVPRYHGGTICCSLAH